MWGSSEGCGLPNCPEVYTNVKHYLKSIEETMITLYSRKYLKVNASFIFLQNFFRLLCTIGHFTDNPSIMIVQNDWLLKIYMFISKKINV